MSERLTYKSAWGDYGSAKDYDSVYDELCDVRNKLGKYEDNEELFTWISCKKKPPKDEGWYLVTVDSDICPIRVYKYEPSELRADGYNKWVSFCIGHVKDDYVLAWMKLPKKYREER